MRSLDATLATRQKRFLAQDFNRSRVFLRHGSNQRYGSGVIYYAP